MDDNPELSEEEWLLARIKEIVDDEQKLEAFEHSQNDREPQSKMSMRAFSFKQIAELVLNRKIGTI